MTREEKLALVGDYVLGVLDDTERAAFDKQIAADPELAAMAVRFAGSMSGLDDTAQPAVYAPDLWSRIEQRLDTRMQAEQAPENIVTLPTRPNVTGTARHWLPLAASVVVALGIGYLAGATLPQGSQPTVIAILFNESDASPAMIIEAFADDSVRLMPLESFAAPDGQVLQVWTLPDIETGPVSLGTLARTQDLRLEGPNLPLPQDGQLYEITLEPAPGSPTGRPTGPILVKGFAKPLLD